jgi:lathosterol oxidase
MSESGKLPGWHHVPDVPLEVSPFFSWPLKPSRMARWLADRWLAFAENTILMALVLISWTWFQPSLEETKTLAFGWIAEIWLRNLVLIGLVAGGLHWFFYIHHGQRDQLKYDPRKLMYEGRQFSFGGQVRDNMFWTLTSGVGFWTAYEVLLFWAMGNGYSPILVPSENPVLFALLFLLTPVWISFHFYWVHRLLHCGWLYSKFHALHHRNINVGPWSGLSMHPIEHLIYFSSALIHFVVPAHPLHILFHMQSQALQAASSHTGYESLLVKNKKSLALGTFHHQMHHRYFEVNYGNLELPWDKWFGTFHDGTIEAHERLKSRRGRRT